MKKMMILLFSIILFSSLVMQPIIAIAAVSPTISYRTHVQTYGWQSYKSNGSTSGTSGQSKRLEGIKIKLSNKEYSGSVQYRTHVQSYGWQNWVSDDTLSGTSGQSKRLEAIQIKLTGEMANKYDVYYRVHAQNFGWMGWAKNGESAGTSSQSKRLEAIQVVLVEKGTTFSEYGKKLAYSSSVKMSPEFINIKNLDSSIIVDLKYNTTDNFTGKRIYNFNQAILRTSTAQKLANANAILKKQGYTIKIWDAYRPYSAQETLWNAYPDPNFVAKPNPANIRGHQLGATIDMTLCYLDTGKEVPMQSKFDDFSSKAYRSYQRTAAQEKYYQMMDKAMKEAGFVGYDKEWWEYRDTNQNFSPLEVMPSLY